MRRTIIAATTLVMANGALAVTTGLNNADIELRISGATASESSIISTLSARCTRDVDVFERTNQVVLACITDNTQFAGLPAGDQLLVVRKSGVGGSGNGVTPVCDGGTVDFMAIDGTAGASGSLGACVSEGPGEWNCTGNTASVALVPHQGISDVGPTEVLDGASGNCQVVNAAFATVFGVPVTTKLRDALQVAQGLNPGSEAEADQPSISNALYTSLSTGKVRRWNEVMVETAGGSPVPLTAVPGVTPPADTRVALVRRVPSSGTYAAAQIKQNKVSCVTGAVGWPDTIPAFQENFQGPVLLPLQSGSSDMSACLTNLNDMAGAASPGQCTGQTIAQFNAGSGSTTKAAGEWAIGMQSMDKEPISEGVGRPDRGGYRFVKLNGVAPCFREVANGSYPLWVTSTVQRSTAVADHNGDGVFTAPPTGAALIIAQAVETSAGPGLLDTQTHFCGESGLAALAENGFPVSYTGGLFNELSAVIPLSHAPSGQQDNCQVPASTGTVILE